MKMKLSLARLCLLSLGTFAVSPALGQLAAPLPGLASESDPAALLSENLKALARDPYNVDALIQAGQGALAIGDSNAAFGFFARAEELSPQSWRAKAGLASSLTMLEKSREALRIFDEAIALGAPEQDVVADRGLAHDLEGNAKQAQRDYLTALRLRPTDEVTRRLALSLGIAGEKEAALARLDPLVRKNDQGAWRARAFILAMNGDTAGAERIVRMVAAPETARSMLGFMQRLNGLGAAAKAHAVHFGTLSVSSGSTSVLVTEDSFQPLDPGAAVKLALAEPERRPVSATNDGSGTGDMRRAARSNRDTQLATLAARGRAAASSTAPNMAAPVASAASTPVTAPSSAAPSSGATQTSMTPPAARFEVPPAPTRGTMPAAPAKQGVAVASQQPSGAAPAAVPSPGSSATLAQTPPAAASNVRAAPAVQTASLPASSVPQMPLPQVATGTVFSSAEPQSTPAVAPIGSANGVAVIAAAQPASPPVSPSAPLSMSAPESEPPVRDLTETTSAPKALEEPIAQVRSAEAAAPAQPLPMAEQTAPPPKPLSLGEIVNTLALESETTPVALPDAARLTALRVAAQKKAAAEEKARAEKAAQERKAAEEAAKARRNPARIWVQIATGRNTSALPRTWRSLKSEAPKALGNLKPWSVGYLQTNRLLVGPLKSSKAARDLVKDLAKEGVAALVFNSEAGQEIDRVDN